MDPATMAMMGATLIGKGIDYFGAKKAARFNPVLKRVQDAKAAGVHPIYALGASNLDSPPAQVSFADTFQKMGQMAAAGNRQQTPDDKQLKTLLLEKAGLENNLLKAQINKMTSETTPTLPALGQKYMVEGQGETALSSIPGTLIEVPRAHKLSPPQYTPNVSMGIPYRTHPKFSDAQTWEDRYGEALGSLLGVVNAGADIVHGSREYRERNWEKIMSRLRKRQERYYEVHPDFRD